MTVNIGKRNKPIEKSFQTRGKCFLLLLPEKEPSSQLFSLNCYRKIFWPGNSAISVTIFQTKKDNTLSGYLCALFAIWESWGKLNIKAECSDYPIPFPGHLYVFEISALRSIAAICSQWPVLTKDGFGAQACFSTGWSEHSESDSLGMGGYAEPEHLALCQGVNSS